jgi:pyruvate/2-oxoglutarate dehydrogenase complex dihydrolipoamide acyltransferase (E2) component
MTSYERHALMIHDVIAPKTGIYDGEVVITAWLAAEGEEVKTNDPLFEMETEKLTAEVEAEESGWLHITVPIGTQLAIGSVVGKIATTLAEYQALQ